MLSIDFDFRKGVLFVRLKGAVTINTTTIIYNEVSEFIIDNGIKNIVFNMEQVNKIDISGINALLFNYKLCRQNNGQAMLCSVDDLEVKEKIQNSKLNHFMYEVGNELVALSIFDI